MFTALSSIGRPRLTGSGSGCSSSSSAGESSAAATSASHSTSRPSASVLSISTLTPLRVAITSPGRSDSGPMAFSTAGTMTTRFTGSFIFTAATKVPMTLAAPHMSYFISSMPPCVFRLTPPVSKVMPLPTST